MSIGKQARLDRIGTDGRFLTVPMDHGITIGAVKGLRDIEATIDAVTRGGADSVLTQKGIAPRVHPNKNDAGYIMHLNASTVLGPAPNDKRQSGTVKEAIRLGADAVSYHINVGSKFEREQIEGLADVTDTAAKFGVPVLAMTYARGPDIDEADAETIAHAVRLGEELGADVIKTAYSGSSESFEQVVSATAKPVVIAGGEPEGDLATLEAVRGAVDAGGAGVSIGRSIFQHDHPEQITRAVAGVIHDGLSAEDALEQNNLEP